MNFDNPMGAIFYVCGQDVVPEYKDLTKIGMEVGDKLSDEMIEFLDMCLQRDLAKRANPSEIIQNCRLFKQ
jgi:hypothetical protein